MARLGFSITHTKVEVGGGGGGDKGGGDKTLLTAREMLISGGGGAGGDESGKGTSGAGATDPAATGGGGTSSGGGGTSSSSSTAAASYAAAAATAAANRTAKIRRVMMAARRPGGAFCGRAGVIVDRARPMVPASAVPEELIAQAQVVLQGKSRDVIVRELQRTNLNVNEAVNNLLSRDDDEGAIRTFALSNGISFVEYSSPITRRRIRRGQRDLSA